MKLFTTLLLLLLLLLLSSLLAPCVLAFNLGCLDHGFSDPLLFPPDVPITFGALHNCTMLVNFELIRPNVQRILFNGTISGNSNITLTHVTCAPPDNSKLLGIDSCVGFSEPILDGSSVTINDVVAQVRGASWQGGEYSLVKFAGIINGTQQDSPSTTTTATATQITIRNGLLNATDITYRSTAELYAFNSAAQISNIHSLLLGNIAVNISFVFTRTATSILSVFYFRDDINTVADSLTFQNCTASVVMSSLAQTSLAKFIEFRGQLTGTTTLAFLNNSFAFNVRGSGAASTANARGIDFNGKIVGNNRSLFIVDGLDVRMLVAQSAFVTAHTASTVVDFGFQVEDVRFFVFRNINVRSRIISPNTAGQVLVVNFTYYASSSSTVSVGLERIELSNITLILDGGEVANNKDFIAIVFLVAASSLSFGNSRSNVIIINNSSSNTAFLARDCRLLLEEPIAPRTPGGLAGGGITAKIVQFSNSFSDVHTFSLRGCSISGATQGGTAVILLFNELLSNVSSLMLEDNTVDINFYETGASGMIASLRQTERIQTMLLHNNSIFIAASCVGSNVVAVTTVLHFGRDADTIDSLALDRNTAIIENGAGCDTVAVRIASVEPARTLSKLRSLVVSNSVVSYSLAGISFARSVFVVDCPSAKLERIESFVMSNNSAKLHAAGDKILAVGIYRSAYLLNVSFLLLSGNNHLDSQLSSAQSDPLSAFLSVAIVYGIGSFSVEGGTIDSKQCYGRASCSVYVAWLGSSPSPLEDFGTITIVDTIIVGAVSMPGVASAAYFNTLLLHRMLKNCTQILLRNNTLHVTQTMDGAIAIGVAVLYTTMGLSWVREVVLQNNNVTTLSRSATRVTSYIMCAATNLNAVFSIYVTDNSHRVSFGVQQPMFKGGTAQAVAVTMRLAGRALTQTVVTGNLLEISNNASFGTGVINSSTSTFAILVSEPPADWVADRARRPHALFLLQNNTMRELSSSSSSSSVEPKPPCAAELLCGVLAVASKADRAGRFTLRGNSVRGMLAPLIFVEDITSLSPHQTRFILEDNSMEQESPNLVGFRAVVVEPESAGTVTATDLATTTTAIISTSTTAITTTTTATTATTATTLPSLNSLPPPPTTPLPPPAPPGPTPFLRLADILDSPAGNISNSNSSNNNRAPPPLLLQHGNWTILCNSGIRRGTIFAFLRGLAATGATEAHYLCTLSQSRTLNETRSHHQTETRQTDTETAGSKTKTHIDTATDTHLRTWSKSWTLSGNFTSHTLSAFPSVSRSKVATVTVTKSKTASLPYEPPPPVVPPRALFSGSSQLLVFGSIFASPGAFSLSRKVLGIAALSECSATVDERASPYYKQEPVTDDAPPLEADVNPLLLELGRADALAGYRGAMAGNSALVAGSLLLHLLLTLVIVVRNRKQQQQQQSRTASFWEACKIVRFPGWWLAVPVIVLGPATASPIGTIFLSGPSSAADTIAPAVVLFIFFLAVCPLFAFVLLHRRISGSEVNIDDAQEQQQQRQQPREEVLPGELAPFPAGCCSCRCEDDSTLGGDDECGLCGSCCCCPCDATLGDDAAKENQRNVELCESEEARRERRRKLRLAELERLQRRRNRQQQQSAPDSLSTPILIQPQAATATDSDSDDNSNKFTTCTKLKLVLICFWNYWMHCWAQWRETDFLLRYGPLYDEFSSHWFVIVDYYSAFFINFVSGIGAGCNSHNCCRFSMFIVLLIAIIHLATIFATSPFLFRLSRCFHWFASVAVLAEAIIGLCGLLGASGVQEVIAVVAQLTQVVAITTLFITAGPVLLLIANVLRRTLVSSRAAANSQKQNQQRSDNNGNVNDNDGDEELRTNPNLNHLLGHDDDAPNEFLSPAASGAARRPRSPRKTRRSPRHVHFKDSPREGEEHRPRPVRRSVKASRAKIQRELQAAAEEEERKDKEKQKQQQRAKAEMQRREAALSFRDDECDYDETHSAAVSEPLVSDDCIVFAAEQQKRRSTVIDVRRDRLQRRLRHNVECRAIADGLPYLVASPSAYSTPSESDDEKGYPLQQRQQQPSATRVVLDDDDNDEQQDEELEEISPDQLRDVIVGSDDEDADETEDNLIVPLDDDDDDADLDFEGEELSAEEMERLTGVRQQQ